MTVEAGPYYPSKPLRLQGKLELFAAMPTLLRVHIREGHSEESRHQ
jgi:hypothetical protein